MIVVLFLFLTHSLSAFLDDEMNSAGWFGQCTGVGDVKVHGKAWQLSRQFKHMKLVTAKYTKHTKY